MLPGPGDWEASCTRPERPRTHREALAPNFSGRDVEDRGARST